MIVAIRLLGLIAAAVVTRASVATSSNPTRPLSDTFALSRPRRGITALRVHRDRLTYAAAGGGEVPPLVRNTPPPGTSAQRGKPFCLSVQRHGAGDAYLTVARRCETGRRDRTRLHVTPYQPGLQGENPGKKERS